jgi:hypothetical protein
MKPTTSTRFMASKGAAVVLAVLVCGSLHGCGPGQDTVPGPSGTYGSGMMMGMMGGPE